MNKFSTIGLSPGEFFDRFTIVLRKAKFNPELYNSQLKEMMNKLSESGFNGTLLVSLCELMMINTDIWNLESDIRKGREDELGLTEVGKRAIEIRKENAIRINRINMINKLFGINKEETKFNHVSEEEQN